MKIKTNVLNYKNPDTGTYTPIPIVVSGDNEEIMKEITELNEKIVQKPSMEQLQTVFAEKGEIENLMTLPYGGSKEWLESNGDTTQLYQIDGYVWGYVEANGWTQSSRQFNIATSENEMTNKGGTPYLLRNGDIGTVYGYREASGDTDVPIYDNLPETANDGDIIAINADTVDSVNDMTDTSKSYVLSSTDTIWSYGTTEIEVIAPNKLVHSTTTLNQRLSGSSGSVSANSSAVGSFVTDFIDVQNFDSISPYNVCLNWVLGKSNGENKIVYYDSSKTRLGNTVFGDSDASNITYKTSETILTISNGGQHSLDFNFADVAFIRLQLFVKNKADGTNITSTDIANLTITFDHEGGTRLEPAWVDTELTAGKKYKAIVTTEEVPAYTNQIPISKDIDGNIVGLIEGCRYDSSDTLVNENIHNAIGFIPVKPGDTIKFQGINFGSTAATDCYLRFYAANYSEISCAKNVTLTPTNIKDNTETAFAQFATDYKLTNKGDISEFTLNNSYNFAYMRLSYLISGSDSNPIITVNEEITDETKTITHTKWVDVGTYVEPVEASWIPTTETHNVIDSISTTANNGDSAVYSVNGYLYTYIIGATWMEMSKYDKSGITIDKNLSLTSTNPVQNKAVSAEIDALDTIIVRHTKDISQLSSIISDINAGGGTVNIPSYWENAVDECISKIKALQVGRNCVTFPFFSDNHQRNGYAGLLIAHIMRECNIPYAFFGGDSISNGYIDSEDTMIAQDKAFDTAMSYIPNGRFCRAVGNHDGFWNVSAETGDEYHYTRAKVYDLFLREESIAQNKHFGDDGTYYYVDDIASKVRFIVLNTNKQFDENNIAYGNSFDSTQLSWLQNTALSFNESGWAVVFISHQPISNHYHAGIDNAAEVRTVIKNYINSSVTNKADIVGWYSGHIHRDRIWTGVAINTSDDSEGEAMGFTQVTITSDHTSIAYDDATKHTVANDDKSHAIDFVTINKTTRKVNITRLGIGSDRSYTY